MAVDVREPAPARSRLTGPLGGRILRHRRALKRRAANHGASNLRVFGSVARGEESEAKVDVLPASDLKPQVARDVVVEAVLL